MANLDRLRKDVETIRRALNTQPEHAENYEELAFNSLSTEQQAKVVEASQIVARRMVDVRAWEKLPVSEKRKSPFYEEYLSLSDIVKSAWLLSWLSTKEENELRSEAASIMIKATWKFDPYYKRCQIH